MKNILGRDPANDKVLQIIVRHVSQSTAQNLFRDLSKIGGKNFRGVMQRLIRVVEEAEMKVKKDKT
jgi:hypothetical protein